MKKHELTATYYVGDDEQSELTINRPPDGTTIDTLVAIANGVTGLLEGREPTSEFAAFIAWAERRAEVLDARVRLGLPVGVHDIFTWFCSQRRPTLLNGLTVIEFRFAELVTFAESKRFIDTPSLLNVMQRYGGRADPQGVWSVPLTNRLMSEEFLT